MLITLNDVKTELQLTANNYDSLLSALIEGVLDLWDILTDRKWQKQVHIEYYDGEEWQDRIFLKNYPVDQNYEVKVWDDPDWKFNDDTLIDSSLISIDYDVGIIYYNGFFNKGKRNIKVEYQAGYDELPKGIKQILIRQVCHWFEDAKNKEWHIGSKTNPVGGGNISKKELEHNLLPEFILLAERERRI